MKNTILHWTSVLLAGTAMTLSACSSDDTDNGGDPAQSPVFPEETQLTIFAGETSVELSFTPNLDWTASLPTSSEASRWFKISDGVMESAVSISGYASEKPVTLYITTTDEEVYDQTPTCEVMLTMGGETKTIARITRSNAAREFSIYASGYTEENGFDYAFGETPLTKFDGTTAPETAPEGTPEFQWPIGAVGFMHVIKVESNFEWLVSTPSWISLAERSTGDGTYFVNVDLDKITEKEIGGAVALVDFYDADIDKITDPGNSAHNRYCFELPAVNEIVRHPKPNLTITFNNAGEYVTEALDGTITASPEYTGSVSSTEGLKFYVALIEDYGSGPMYVFQNNFNQWITVEDTWDENGNLFQEHNYTITTAANEGEARSAKVIALPKVLADQIKVPQMDLLSPDQTDFKDEYKPYVFATIEQKGLEAESNAIISLYDESNSSAFYPQNGNDPVATLADADDAFFAENDEEFLTDIKNAYDGGTPVYVITYASNNPYDSVNGILKINVEGKVTPEYSASWLDAIVEGDMMVINMDADKQNSGSMGDMGYITLKQDDAIIGYIICIRNFESTTTPPAGE